MGKAFRQAGGQQARLDPGQGGWRSNSYVFHGEGFTTVL
jgi:hypothetical protein